MRWRSEGVGGLVMQAADWKDVNSACRCGRRWQDESFPQAVAVVSGEPGGDKEVEGEILANHKAASTQNLDAFGIDSDLSTGSKIDFVFPTRLSNRSGLPETSSRTRKQALGPRGFRACLLADLCALKREKPKFGLTVDGRNIAPPARCVKH